MSRDYTLPDAPAERLTQEEESALFAEYYAGNLEARDELIAAKARLACFIAAKHQRGNLSPEDVSEAVWGLIQALESHHFDPAKGFAFSAFAHRYITGAICRSYRVVDAVSYPAGDKMPLWRDDEEAIGNWDLRRHVSVEAALATGLLSPDAELDPSGFNPEELDHSALAEALGKLAPKERRLIELHFLEGVDLAKAARKVGVSRQHANDLRSRALDKLRTALTRSTAEKLPPGVQKHNKKYYARVYRKKKQHCLGVFDTAEEAAKIVSEFRKEAA